MAQVQILPWSLTCYIVMEILLNLPRPRLLHVYNGKEENDTHRMELLWIK